MNKFKEEILMIAESAEGKTFGDIDQLNLLSEKGNKGALGHVIEENIFNYRRNSNSEMDFPKAKMELKVTPYKKNKNGTYSAKERLVLNIIDYMKEYKFEFYESTVWKKCSDILLFLYEYKKKITRDQFKITHTYDLDFNDESHIKDLKIIKQDYNIIRDKILSGNAHTLSEGDTMYLGACTKGATAASSFRKQPFNDAKAKQRAFSFKTTYMTQLIRSIILSEKNETIFLDEDLNENLSFEENIRQRVSKYFGMSVKELKEELGVETKAKNANEVIFSRMLNVSTKLSNTDEFLKANIIPKYIRVNSNGSITESMSFPTFKYEDIVKQTWHKSELYEYFNTQKFLFVIFKYNISGDLLFQDIKLWNMPNDILENEIVKVFNKTKEIIKSGNIVRKITPKGKRLTNLPDKRFNNYAHVRPHARNRDDSFLLPIPDKLTGLNKYTKHCFWLNNNYIKDIISIH
jgi:hypothetical protein